MKSALTVWVIIASSVGASTCGKHCDHSAPPVPTISRFPTVYHTAPQITIPYSVPSGYVFGSRTTPTSTSSKPSVTAECIVTPLGWGQDDSGQIMAAVDRCGTDGIITLPAPYVYTISQRLYMKLVRAQLNIFGTLSFEPNLGYWIDNSHRVEFQNQSTAWIIEGNDFVVSGGGWQQGGINGNGQPWYGRAAGHSNQYGRPISLSIWKSQNATVKDFSIRQPQFWSFYIQDSQDVKLTGIYINGTNTDPAGNSSNYETNVDGFDSIRVNGLETADWVFHGGDDCHAPKGNSTNMVFRNLTCVGGGIAFGSIGQYPDMPDYITNVSVSNISVTQQISPVYGGAKVNGGIYFKSWVGVSEGEPPQGGGGGTGRVSNVTVSDVKVHNITQAVYINKCYYKVADQANYCDTSTLNFENMTFTNIEGLVGSSYGISLNCSAKAPCFDMHFSNLDLVTANGSVAGAYCDNVNNVTGIKCSS